MLIKFASQVLNVLHQNTWSVEDTKQHNMEGKYRDAGLMLWCRSRIKWSLFLDLPLPVRQAGPFFQPLWKLFYCWNSMRVAGSTTPPSSAATRVSARGTAVSDDPPHRKIQLASEEQVQVTVLGPDWWIKSCSEYERNDWRYKRIEMTWGFSSGPLNNQKISVRNLI